MYRRILYRTYQRQETVRKTSEIKTPKTIMAFLQYYQSILNSFFVADNLSLKNIVTLEMIYDRLKDGSKRVNVAVFDETEEDLRQKLLQKINDIVAKHQLYISDEDDEDDSVTIHSCRTEPGLVSLAASSRTRREDSKCNNQDFSRSLSPGRNSIHYVNNNKQEALHSNDVIVAATRKKR